MKMELSLLNYGLDKSVYNKHLGIFIIYFFYYYFGINPIIVARVTSILDFLICINGDVLSLSFEPYYILNSNLVFDCIV